MSVFPFYDTASANSSLSCPERGSLDTFLFYTEEFSLGLYYSLSTYAQDSIFLEVGQFWGATIHIYFEDNKSERLNKAIISDHGDEKAHGNER